MKTEADWMTQIADQNAREALTHARGTLARAMQELDAYIAKFEEADAPARKAEVLNWTLHHLATYIAPNLRLDQIANAQAAFSSQGR